MLVPPLGTAGCADCHAPGFRSRTWAAKVPRCCYFALPKLDFSPFGLLFPFAGGKKEHHWVVMVFLLNWTLNCSHSFQLTDLLMEAFQTVVVLFSPVNLCPHTPSTSRPTAKQRGCLPVAPRGEESEQEHSKARLAVWPAAAARALLSPRVHFTHKAASEFVH